MLETVGWVSGGGRVVPLFEHSRHRLQPFGKSPSLYLLEPFYKAVCQSLTHIVRDQLGTCSYRWLVDKKITNSKSWNWVQLLRKGSTKNEKPGEKVKARKNTLEPNTMFSDPLEIGSGPRCSNVSSWHCFAPGAAGRDTPRVLLSKVATEIPEAKAKSIV